ncbi:Orm1 type endoplasmic reticulum protein [Macrolepiota fuliginosa MF-IS2]|uniref:Orm1 type endoplasmic reticulum protein n=1 Tax=Macrolepiota fuliginosa MF-IS2 TaxID=1400762 RepID=A0A9P5X2R9_9AGAR|nr:Orm1 type endoplasmic reticulum protein [Macrolepiota fuliginosa MF-IS2]
MSRSPSITLPVLDLNAPAPTPLRARARSSSIVKVEEVKDRSAEDVTDRDAYLNINANWVNAKGAWLIHVVLILTAKVIIDTIPGMTHEISWTLVNLIYLTLSYVMFHGVTGIPFGSDLHSGAYDDLTLWEQIDDGAQYTPAKKWLFCLPIGVFLASTHYTHYNPWLFAINLSALILVLIPKLPQFHRQRVRFMTHGSGFATPVSASFPGSGASTPTLDPSIPTIITDAHFK